MKILILLLASLSPVVGQSQYRSGILLTNSQDTIQGLLRFEDDARMPLPCFYKPNSTGSVSEYVPGSIFGFRFDNDKYFVSRSIGKSADVFLEVLVEGNVTLYKFQDIYFIQKADSAFFELSDEVEEMQIEGEQIKAKTRNHTRMLLLMMGDCVEASRMVSSTALKEKPLIRLVSTYNTCKGYSNLYFRKAYK